MHVRGLYAETQRERWDQLSSSKKKELLHLRKQAIAKRAERVRRGHSYESPGRKVGKVEGSWIDDIAGVRQCIMLCWKCNPKFDPKPHQYVHDKFFRVSGKCDGCRSNYSDGSLRFYIHESYLYQGHKLHQPVR